MKDHDTRLAVLEIEQRHHKDTLNDVVDQLMKLNDHVTEINRKLDRNTGFLAGAAFVFSLIGAFIGMGGAEIWKRITG